VDSFSSQFSIADIGDIDTLIDRKALTAKFWKDDNDLDLKRRKEAEFLVLGDIASEAILGYIVYNKNANNRLINLGIPESKVKIQPAYYF
jgi:hypothetical protein